jgi:TM2 domain-containing membrane protein YozV
MKKFFLLNITLVLFVQATAAAQSNVSPRLDLFRPQDIYFQGQENFISQSNSLLPSLSEGISTGKKNVGLAVVYSLLLPGMGELYVGEYRVGKYFTIAEGMLWLTFTSLELYGTWLRDDARRFAVTHAAINPEGKDDQYFIDIGNYFNLEDYTASKLRNRELDKIYDPSTHSWQWDNDANRTLYRGLRISHDRVFNNNQFVVAAIIVNHIVSAVNAGRLAISYNKSVEQSSRLEIHASVLGGLHAPHGIMISVSQSF